MINTQFAGCKHVWHTLYVHSPAPVYNVINLRSQHKISFCYIHFLQKETLCRLPKFTTFYIVRSVQCVPNYVNRINVSFILNPDKFICRLFYTAHKMFFTFCHNILRTQVENTFCTQCTINAVDKFLQDIYNISLPIICMIISCMTNVDKVE